MKIIGVKTFVVGSPPPYFGGRYWIFVKLTTDGGVEGVGEVYSVPFHPKVVAQMIGDVCERCVIGADPFKVEKLWRIVYSSGFTQRPDTSILGILSGIETACINSDRGLSHCNGICLPSDGSPADFIGPNRTDDCSIRRERAFILPILVLSRVTETAPP